MQEQLGDRCINALYHTWPSWEVASAGERGVLILSLPRAINHRRTSHSCPLKRICWLCSKSKSAGAVKIHLQLQLVKERTLRKQEAKTGPSAHVIDFTCEHASQAAEKVQVRCSRAACRQCVVFRATWMGNWRLGVCCADDWEREILISPH